MRKKKRVTDGPTEGPTDRPTDQIYNGKNPDWIRFSSPAQDNFGYDLAAIEAATKKHEAIETDIYAYEERVTAVVAVAKELEAENYHDISRINARKDNVLRLWNYLLELLRARRTRLELSLGLQRIFQV